MAKAKKNVSGQTGLSYTQKLKWEKTNIQECYDVLKYYSLFHNYKYNMQILRILFLVSVIFNFGGNSYGQQAKEPSLSDIKGFCDCIAVQVKPTEKGKKYFEYWWEEQLAEWAGADFQKESQEEVAEKIKSYWNKYKTRFGCNSMFSNIKGGSVLKFAAINGFITFIETAFVTYGMDISFVDPADGRTLCEFMNEQLFNRIGRSNAGVESVGVKVWKNYIEQIGDLTWDINKPACQLNQFAANSNWNIGGKVEFSTFFSNGVVTQKGGHEGEIIAYNADYTQFLLRIDKFEVKADLPSGIKLNQGMRVWLSIKGWQTKSDYKK